MKRVLIPFIIVCFYFSAPAQVMLDSLRLECAIEGVFDDISVDEFNYIYTLQNEEGLLKKYSPKGELNYTYHNEQYGRPTQLMLPNPLSTLLYYPDYQLLVNLDRQLNEIETQQLEVYNPNVEIHVSSQGDIWIFDSFEQQLQLLSEDGEVEQRSDPMYQIAFSVNGETEIQSNANYVFLIEKGRGIYLFDHLANFQTFISMKNIQFIQADKTGFMYLEGKLWKKMDVDKGTIRGLIEFGEIPEIKKILYFKDRCLVLDDEKVSTYTIAQLKK